MLLEPKIANVYFFQNASFIYFITNKKKKSCHPPSSFIGKFGLRTIISNFNFMWPNLCILIRVIYWFIGLNANCN